MAKKLTTEQRSKIIIDTFKKFRRRKVVCYKLDQELYLRGIYTIPNPDNEMRISARDLDLWSDEIYIGDYKLLLRHKKTKEMFLTKAQFFHSKKRFIEGLDLPGESHQIPGFVRTYF